MPPIEPVEVFISYHEKDEKLREELEKHLTTLHREKAITSWHDRKIVAGQEIKGEIDKYLNRAGLILLLVSPDFLASDYHWTVEITRALERNAAGKARVIPVLLRHADWETAPIDKLSPLPRNRQPVKSWTDWDEAFLQVIRGIREEVERLVANSNYSPPKQNSAVQTPLALKPSADNVPSQSGSTSTGLTLELPISIGELTYGTEKRIALEDGSINVTIPPGLSPGKKLRIRGKGKLNPLTQEREDLYLKIVSTQGVEVSLEDYQKKLRRYEQELTKVLQVEYPLSDYSIEGLKNYQHLLGLRKEDIALLEERVTAQELEKRQYQVTSLINEADLLLKDERLEEAALKYKAALLLDPNNTNAHSLLGLALKDQGKLEEAIACYRQALRLDPNHAIVHSLLGMALHDQGKLEEAIACYRQALRLNPNYADVHYTLGIALHAQGKLEEAIACYRQALRLDPNHANAHNNLGLALYNQGRLEEAIACYRQALRLNPNHADIHYILGVILKDQGKLEEAIACYRQALRLNPNFANAHNNLGVILHDQGRLEEAIACYRQALRLNPNDAIVHSLLGLALKAQGKLEEAIAELEQAIRLDPSNSLFRDNLKTIRN
ncbi:tetratricopeptide repeat protein [Microcoleus sp. ZQ-A2]|nr:tetratricopeptide repeat protein [Microcoleus sp. FACHB-1]